jgi:hypothetical protein
VRAARPAGPAAATRRAGDARTADNTPKVLLTALRAQPSVLPPCDRSASPDGLHWRWSANVWWAREELNLRPLPCQIPRGFASLYVRRLKTGKDRRKAAGERRYQCPSYPTIHHGSPAVVLLPTAVGCCPSAARRRNPDLRDHNPNRTGASSQLHELDPRRPAVPLCRWRPLATNDALGRPS